jgi:hypothetical protein
LAVTPAAKPLETPLMLVDVSSLKCALALRLLCESQLHFNQGGSKMATKKQQSKRPTNTLRCGNIKATIWENTSEKGSFYATTFSRPFTVVSEAKEWMAAHALKR